MNRSAKFSALAIAVLVALAASAHAVKPTTSTATAMPACSFSDLTGLSVLACTGFFQGKLLNGGTGATLSSEIATQLGLLGVANAATAAYIEMIGSWNGGFTANFTQPLVGDTVIGLHRNISGGATAFYKFNAGTNLDSFGLAPLLTASSGVAILQTSPVPEPESCGLMLAGPARARAICHTLPCQLMANRVNRQ